MVTLGYIQGIRETAPLPGTDVRNRATKGSETLESGEDRIEISTEAREASALAQLASQVRDSEIRQEKVEEAKRRLEEGTYRLVSIVNIVAERISGIATV